jgi:hypothetical protein
MKSINTQGLKIPVSAVRFRPWAQLKGFFARIFQAGSTEDPNSDASSQSNSSPEPEGRWVCGCGRHALFITLRDERGDLIPEEPVLCLKCARPRP